MYRLLFGNEQRIKENSYFWNTFAGLVNAGEAVILSMVVTRVTGLEDAGILAIAFAIANQLMTIGKFGVRNYQVTDSSEKNDFCTYFYLRLFTCFVMIVGVGCYVLYGIVYVGYSNYKAGVIFCICLLYVTESIEDVFCGRWQQKGRIDVGARIFVYRWIIVLFTFCLLTIISGNMVVATIIAVLSGIMVDYITLRYSNSYLNISWIKADYKKIYKLFMSCLPLSVISYLKFFIMNSPKYAIDLQLSDELQACYGFVFMPVYVIGLLNSFIYQPKLVEIADYWNERELRKFCKEIKKLSVYVIGITIFCFIALYFLGIPILSFIYNTNLKANKIEMLVLIFGGGMLGIVELFYVILTVMRQQTKMLPLYVVVAILSKVISVNIIKKYQLFGASLLFFCMMMILGCGLISIFMFEFYKEKNVN